MIFHPLQFREAWTLSPDFTEVTHASIGEVKLIPG
jgi:hypothetical protein